MMRPYVFQHHKSLRSRQISASVRGSKVPSRVGGDQPVNVFGIRQNGFTRAHGNDLSRKASTFFLAAQFPAHSCWRGSSNHIVNRQHRRGFRQS